MNMSHLTNQNSAEPGRIAFNAAMYVAIEEHDSKEVLVCRPHPHLTDNEEYMEIFSRQGLITESFTNPHCLRYVSYESDERGPFWLMTQGKFVSLAQMMVEKTEMRLDEKWVDRTITDLLDAVQYVNNVQHVQLELTPQSILVSKDSKHSVMLMPPLTDFVPLKKTLWMKENEQIAPELFNIEVPDNRADLYGIGRIIQYLHPYPNLPYKYSALVKKAVSERVDHRPLNSGKFQSAIKKREKGGNVASIIATVSVIAALFMIVLLYPWEEEPKYDFQNLMGRDTTLFDDGVLTGNNYSDPLVNTDITSATEAEKERMLEDYLHDSIYMSMDTAYSLSPEMKQYQRQMMQMASEKFRAAFKIQAKPILTNMYTDENMKSQEKFLRVSNEANTKLVKIQESLTKQYQLDPSTATRIAGEVYDEILNTLKNNRKK